MNNHTSVIFPTKQRQKNILFETHSIFMVYIAFLGVFSFVKVCIVIEMVKILWFVAYESSNWGVYFGTDTSKEFILCSLQFDVNPLSIAFLIAMSIVIDAYLESKYEKVNMALYSLKQQI